MGKAITAPGSFLLVFVLAAVMPRSEYAGYVVATSAMELSLAIGSLGLDWMMQTAVPGARLYGSAAQLKRVIALVAAMQTAPYLIGAACFWFFANGISQLYGDVATPAVMRIYAFVLLTEGLARMIRDQILSALLMQRMVQILSLLRLIVMATSVAVFWYLGISITAVNMAYTELAAAGLTLLVGMVMMLHHLHSISAGSGGSLDISPWLGRKAFNLAFHAYASFMLTLFLGAELSTMFVARHMGVEATAQFGFAMRVIDQVRRFLPMDLLWSIIRPSLVGRYENFGRSFERLASDVTFILRANLILLGGIMVIFIGIGDSMVGIVTRGNLHLPTLLVVAFIPQVLGHSSRRSLELISFVIGRSHLFFRGSFASLVVPVMLFVLVPLYGSLYVVALSTAVAEALFSGLVFWGLRQDGHKMIVRAATWIRLLISISICGGIAMLIEREWPTTGGMIAAVLVGGTAYLVSLVPCGIVTTSEIALVLQTVRARLGKTGNSSA